MVSLRQFVFVCVFLAVNIAIGSGTERGKCTPTEVAHGYDCGNFNNATLWGKCRIRGDPHFLTWDGVKYDYNADCIYTILGFCDDSVNLAINVDMQLHPTRAGRYKVVSVTIAWGGASWELTDAKDIVSSGAEAGISAYTEALTSDMEAMGAKPIKCLVVRIFENEGMKIEERVRAVFYPEFGLVFVNIAKPWATSDGKKVCGMCGTPNGIASDDLKAESNKPPEEDPTSEKRRRKRMAGDASEIADAWTVPGSCPL